MPIDTARFKRTVGLIPAGISVISLVDADGAAYGMTASSVASLSLKPPMLLVCVDDEALIRRAIVRVPFFGVSVLAAGQAELSDRFAGRANDEAPQPAFEIVHETPLVEGAAAQFVSKVEKSYWGGDHSLFLGRVEYACYDESAQPLLFHGGQYGGLSSGAELA